MDVITITIIITGKAIKTGAINEPVMCPAKAMSTEEYISCIPGCRKCD